MKNLIKIGLTLVGCSYSIGVLSDSVVPEEPGAYEPFTIEVLVHSPRGEFADTHLIHQATPNDGTILIGYVRPGGGLSTAPPYTWLEIDIPGLPPGNYTVKTAYMPDLANGEVTIEDTELTFTIAETPPTQPAYALFHIMIEHYFITASDEEADALLAQYDWEMVDFGFNVWHADDPAPEAAQPVCRFYSEQVNSHFYTASKEECTMLQEEDHGWAYEGIAFQALVPTDGACPTGTDPVWRLYNDRAAEMDSNHRFVVSSETYRAMITDGWLGEGVAFCSPPASVAE